MAEDDDDDGEDDTLVVRPEGHAKCARLRERPREGEGKNTHVRIDRLILARPEDAWPMIWLKVYSA